MPSTISSEISRISGNVSAALTAISNKGVTVPSGSNSDDLADLIGQISTSGGDGVIITDTTDANGGTIRTITATEISGTKTITANGTGIDVTSYAAVDVAVPATTPSLQAKTNISPTTSSQTIEADSGYDGLSSVQINAMPSGSVTAPSTISGSSATVSTGTNTLTLSKTVSVTPTVSTAGYVSSGTAGNSSVSLTASVTTKAATTYHPSTSDQTIASGTYTTGAQTIKAVTLSNLTAANIKSGVTVKVGDSTDDDCVTSVTGTYEGGGSSKAVYTYLGLASRTANSYGATNAKVTVTKAGTYNIYYVAIRGSSSGTMGTNLHIGDTAKGNFTTWNNGTYGQYNSYTNQTIAANTDVTIYATSGSTSRSIYVGQLIVEEV